MSHSFLLQLISDYQDVMVFLTIEINEFSIVLIVVWVLFIVICFAPRDVDQL